MTPWKRECQEPTVRSQLQLSVNNRRWTLENGNQRKSRRNQLVGRDPENLDRSKKIRDNVHWRTNLQLWITKRGEFYRQSSTTQTLLTGDRMWKLPIFGYQTVWTIIILDQTPSPTPTRKNGRILLITHNSNTTTRIKNFAPWYA